MNTLRVFGLGAMALAIVCAATPAVAQNPPPAITLRPPTAPAAPSASPEALQAAKELVSFVSRELISQMTSGVTAQVWPGIETNLRAMSPTIDAETIADLHNEYEKLQISYISEIVDEAPSIYARYFSAQEMRDITAFYRTPAGAKTLKVMPRATADLFALVTPRMQGMQERVNLAFLNILQKHGLYAK